MGHSKKNFKSGVNPRKNVITFLGRRIGEAS